MVNRIKCLVIISKELFDNKLVTGKAGNISIRYDKNIIAITPTQKSLGDLKIEDIVLADFDGNVLTGGKPSSEIKMHIQIYKDRSDVNAIIHTHSPYATGFAHSSKRIRRHEGFGKIKQKYLSELKYEKPGSSELATGVTKAMKKENILILKNHGVIIIDNNLKEAAELAKFVEETAKTQFITLVLNNIKF